VGGGGSLAFHSTRLPGAGAVGASLQETSCMSVTERKPALGAEECVFTLVQSRGVFL
jgi:hypothetical protein